MLIAGLALLNAQLPVADVAHPPHFRQQEEGATTDTEHGLAFD